MKTILPLIVTMAAAFIITTFLGCPNKEWHVICHSGDRKVYDGYTSGGFYILGDGAIKIVDGRSNSTILIAVPGVPLNCLERRESPPRAAEGPYRD